VRRFVLGLIAFLTLEVVLLTADTLFPPDVARGQRSSPVVVDRRGVWLRALPVETGRWRIRADLDRTDPAFLRRLIRVEGSRFFSHGGVDPLGREHPGVGGQLEGAVRQHQAHRARRAGRGGRGAEVVRWFRLGHGCDGSLEAMASHTIRIVGDPVLRQPAREIADIDAALVRLAGDMVQTI